jgi:hypothetical protein
MAEKKSVTRGGKKLYRQYFAIMGDADDPSTWKLPHHTGGQGDVPHAQLSVNWGQARAAIVAAVSGQFRGNKLGATMAQRKTAARHLATHYRKAKKDVPEGLSKFISSKGESRLVDRGQPLEEVKGSAENHVRQVRSDFYHQFKDQVREDEAWYPYIVETFAGHVIVREANLPEGEFYLVSYAPTGDGHYSFADREDWTVVELAYQIKSELTESKKFREVLTAAVTLEEGAEGGRTISGTGITADTINANGRRYPYPVLKRAVDQAISHLNESTGQGRLAILGEADHPSDKGHRRPQFLETIVNWTELSLDPATKQVAIRGTVLETSKGRDALAIMEGGVMPGISIRGYGISRQVEDAATGRMIEEVTELTITGFDLLVPGEQSDPNGQIDVIEGRDAPPAQEESAEMDPEEVLQALQESGVLDQMTGQLLERLAAAQAEQEEGQRQQALREALGVESDGDIIGAVRALIEEAQHDPSAVETALRESLGVGEHGDVTGEVAERMARLQELEEAEQRRQVEAHITEAVGALSYPDWLKEQLIEAVQAEEPGTVEEAQELIESRRKEYGGFVSRMELAARGHKHGLEVLGPVIERDAGVPAYAQAAFEIQESFRRSQPGIVVARDLRVPSNVNERFAAEYIRRFDEKYRHYLAQEAELLAEAEQTSDLNLPYSVSRTIIAEAIPTLVATSIYDVGLASSSEERVYYEAYSGETGEQVAVAAEDFTSDLGAWVSLANKRIIPNSTISVEPDGGGTALVEGTDYVLDYGNGRIWCIAAAAGGSMTDATTYEIDYDYKAYRKGEMQAIERGKGTLSYTTLSMLADRLATEISTEAVVFSRSQLGWDATARTLSMLVFEIAKKIDQDLMYLALAGALIVASNSGGTWTQATDTLDELIQKIGAAKVLVHNRYYMPDHILLSVTNSDIVSNWDGFTAAGQRPDGTLNANGMVGRLKGLPVYESTEMSDGYILVANREIVHHRVLQPMILKGPYPSYSSNKLIASEQYYAEEFNGSDAPVPEKAAYVKIA